MSEWISIYEFDNAPQEWRALSPHGGDEDWLAFVPDSMMNNYMPFLEVGRFGNDVTEHKVSGGVVFIAAHA